MFTLAIIHVDTTNGPCRLTLSEELDGTLVIERNGSGYQSKVAEIRPMDDDPREDANSLLRIGLNDIENVVGRVVATHQIPHL
jgi:hypothetical protein